MILTERNKQILFTAFFIFGFTVSFTYLKASDIEITPGRAIADSLMYLAFEDIFVQSGLRAGDTVNTDKIYEMANTYVVFKFDRLLQDSLIITDQSGKCSRPSSLFLIDKFGFQYLNTDNPDNVIREFNLDFSFSISSGRIINSKKYYTDTIPRLFISSDFQRQAPYTNGKLPEPDDSWWDSIAEPVVVISVAVISAILLFTVRSK